MKPTLTDGAGRPSGNRFDKIRELARGDLADYDLGPEPLDRGGQADVFSALHNPSRIRVAVKRLREVTPNDVARMRREIDAARDLDGHPHIMPVLDHSDQHDWLVMPLAAHNAAAVRHTLSDDGELRGLVTSVCAAMREAHRYGWIHRDLKPANLLRFGGGWAVADWGLARRPRGLTTDSGRTRIGAALGTEGFAAPELSYDAHGAGPQADVYSIGQIIGWAVTGELPRANIPLIPPGGPWRQVVRAAAQPRPELRPATIGELLEMITEQLDYGQPYDSSAALGLLTACNGGDRRAAARLFTIAARHAGDPRLYLTVLPQMARDAVVAAVDTDLPLAAEVARAMGERARDPGLDEAAAARITAWLHWVQVRAAQAANLGLLEEAVCALLLWDEAWPGTSAAGDIERWLRGLRGDAAAAVALALRERPGSAVHFAEIATDARADERIRRAVRRQPPLVSPPLVSPADAPPLPAGLRPHKRLPAEVTSFVGRQEELGQLAGLLGKARLVSVTGPGGVGKTRLAFRAAARQAGRRGAGGRGPGGFPDGVCLADLAEVRDPELLTDHVASCLGLPARPRGCQLDAVMDFLRPRRLLLVLDTCEHIIDECATLAEAILRQAPYVTILATTRQPLDVAGEHCLPVPPLPVPSLLTPRAGGDAVELFEHRAAAATGNFTVTAANRADVIQLCRHLEGMPLEIELAAARLRALPLDLLTERLVSKDLLTERLVSKFQVLSGSRSPVTRHRSIHDAIAWTYDLCTPAEQALWQRVSVFANTFDIDGAEFVCADQRSGERARDGLGGGPVVEVLAGLTNKSVVMQEGTHAAAFRMLDTYREFGLAQLTTLGEVSLRRGRHLDHYLALAQRFEERFAYPGGEVLFRRLRADHLNIRAALDFALGAPPSPEDQDHPGTRGTELAVTLWPYWRMAGLLLEGRSWISKALEGCPSPSRQRARALVARGHLGVTAGLLPDAISDLREGIALAVQLGADHVAATGYLDLNQALTFAEYYEEAAEASAEARRRFETLGVHAALLTVDCQLALLETCSGSPGRAVERCAASLRAAPAGGSDAVGDELRGFLHTAKAFAHLTLGDVPACHAHAREGLRLLHGLDDWFGVAWALETFANAAATRGNHERSAFLLGASEAQWGETAVLCNATFLTDLRHRMLTEVRSALGPERFGERYATGARTALDDVVAYVLSDSEPRRDSEPGRDEA